jgi:hypothetical protein
VSAAPVLRREPETAADHRCPLCGGGFAEQHHCSVCPLSARCHILCCPHCGYSFVERSGVVDFFRRLFRRPPRDGEPASEEEEHG